MNIFRQLLVQAVLIFLNAFFAMTEIAVISLNATKLKRMAEEGDKTLVDALAPAVVAFEAGLSSGEGERAAWAAAARAATAGRDATIPLVARKGRASYLGERSAGHQDPGATSMALLLAAAATTLGGP